MKKQLIIVCVLLILAGALSVTSVRAQAGGQVKAEIPFSFTAGGKLLPAGTYIIYRRSAGEVEGLVIRNTNGSDAAMFNTRAGQPEESGSPARLVFNKYGDQYFLAEIFSNDGSTGHKLLKSRREREIEREIAQSSKGQSIAKTQAVVYLNSRR